MTGNRTRLSCNVLSVTCFLMQVRRPSNPAPSNPAQYHRTTPGTTSQWNCRGMPRAGYQRAGSVFRPSPRCSAPETMPDVLARSGRRSGRRRRATWARGAGVADGSRLRGSHRADRLAVLTTEVAGPRVRVAARFAAAVEACDGSGLAAVSEEFELMGDLVAALDTAVHAAMAYRGRGLRASALG
jgi:hypothetical protein